MRVLVWLALVGSCVAHSACGLVGPSCVDRQRRGTVVVVTGVVEPGEITVHVLPYGVEGSQNDIEISWSPSNSSSPPRLEAYATRAACSELVLPTAANVGDCRVIAASALQIGSRTASLIVTHGQGNPEILGTPAEYKLWVVGDTAQRVSYTLTATWFRGPDC